MIYLSENQSIATQQTLSSTKSITPLETIFKALREVAQNWGPEAIGRFYYYECTELKPQFQELASKIRIVYADSLDTFCAFTAEIVLTVLFDLGTNPQKAFEDSAACLSFDMKKPLKMAPAFNLFLNNFNALNSDTEFFVYYINIYWGDFGHVFTVLQYRNIAEPLFRIYQSFLENYTLAEYLDKHDTALTFGQFSMLLFDLTRLFKHHVIDERLKIIMERQFLADPRFDMGEPNNIKMTIHYKQGYLSTFDKVHRNFSAFKASRHFPTFESNPYRNEWTVMRDLPAILVGPDIERTA